MQLAKGFTSNWYFNIPVHKLQINDSAVQDLTSRAALNLTRKGGKNPGVTASIRASQNLGKSLARRTSNRL